MPSENSPLPDESPLFGEPIFVYTRQQALADGVLIDVTSMAREAGIRYPVAVTHRLWHEQIEASEQLQKLGQDTQGRLWDVLWMLRLAILRGGSGSELTFEVLFRRENNQLETQQLRSICGPNDDGTPCITILLPDED